jgi:hypothetical protein
MLALPEAMQLLDTEDIVLTVVLGIPVLAIIGGIVVGVVRTVGQQRQIELAQRERIAAIERGLDPSKLPQLGPVAGEDLMSRVLGSPLENARRRYQGLLIAGILTIAIGIGMTTLFSIVEQHGESWAIGIVPMTLGVGLLLSAWLVRPRGNGSPPRM